MISKPMLAGKFEDIGDLSSIRYPVLATPKLDGIRCITRDGTALSRSLKLIPNKHVQKMFKGLPDHLDGELMLKSGDFNTVQSAIMREDGKPDFVYNIFDYCKEHMAPYNKRIDALSNFDLPDFCVRLYPFKIENEQELNNYENIQVTVNKYEGIMIRQPDSPYKFGRSTPKEQFLMKIKRFDDSEAEIIGFEELMHNDNQAEEDKLGHTKRSSKKEGLVPAGTLGMLKVRDIHNGIEFGLGTGFTAELRKTIWDEQSKYKGLIVKYKYQGIVEKPRFPSFIGFRSKDDI